ncbi:hypothetical protein M422DRAFT_64543 [Sphaerobolus stellatus SS14]|nr:hypothetical protein M422DRAFT_64543 [Sphaerobolus stellatus SS14]
MWSMVSVDNHIAFRFNNLYEISKHVAISGVQVLFAFRHTTITEADDFYGSLGWNVAKFLVYVLLTLAADAFMLYRVYIVTGRIAMLIAPSIIFLGDAGCGIGALVSLTQYVKNVEGDRKKHARISASFFIATLLFNALCTVLLSHRVWKLQKQMAVLLRSAKAFTKVNDRVIIIVLESGAIYSVMQILIVSTLFSESSAALNILLAINCPLVGIVVSSTVMMYYAPLLSSSCTSQFSLMIVRSTLASSFDRSTLHPLTTMVFATVEGQGSLESSQRNSAAIELSPMNENQNSLRTIRMGHTREKQITGGDSTKKDDSVVNLVCPVHA